LPGARAAPYSRRPEEDPRLSPTDDAFWEAVDRIRDGGAPYRREAYGFVVAALGHAVGRLPAERRADEQRRHLSGRELLDAAVALARSEFGPLAPMVFREWGVTGAEDVGRMVFHLVEAGQLSARPEDTMSDFAGGPDLLVALGDGLEPDARRPAGGRPGGA
jgi:uncharacterized repeat protein (TIGR04138 family)